MADLKTVLTDIASAIKYKLEDDTPIAPVDFAEQILAIPVEGGGYSDPTPIINGTVKTVSNSASFIRAYAFYGCSKLTTANFPECITIRDGVFDSCYTLRATHFEKCEYIGNQAFRNCSALSSISFPACTYIGDEAFEECKIPEAAFPNCEYIGSRAFAFNYILSSIELPAVKIISSGAFMDCSVLSSINLPECTTIGDDAFMYCRSLNDISVPKCVSLGTSAFYYCSALPSTLELPNVSEIMGMTFRYTPLRKLIIPNCTQISNYGGRYVDSGPFDSEIEEVYAPKCYLLGHGAFRGCNKLSSLTVDYSNMHYIENQVFVGTKFTNLSFPRVTHIGSSCFSNCSTLSEIYLQWLNSTSEYAFYGCNNLSIIGENNVLPVVSWLSSYTFDFCSALPEITLKNCSRIGSYAFFGCNNLSKFVILSSSCSLGSSVFGKTPIADSSYLGYFGSIYVRSEYVSTYKAAQNWSIYSDRITTLSDPEKYIFPAEYASSDITEVPSEKVNAIIAFESAFRSCSNLTSVYLPSCLYVESAAFSNCSNLQTVDLPMCISVGSSIFSLCSSLKSINMPNLRALEADTIPATCQLESYNFDNVRVINARNFKSQSIVTQVSFPYCSYIGGSTFMDCSNLSYINLPSCSLIYDYAFANCYNLSTLVLGSGISEIYSSAFYNCSNLTSLVLSTVGYQLLIRTAAFENCINLSIVSLENVMASHCNIWPSAFKNCQALATVTLPEKLAYIGECAFENCFNLSTIEIPNAVSSIGYNAFNNCSALTFNENDIGYYLGNRSNSFYALYSLKSTITEYSISQSTCIVNGCLRDATMLSTLNIGYLDTSSQIGPRLFNTYNDWSSSSYAIPKTTFTIVLANGASIIPAECFKNLSVYNYQEERSYGLADIHIPLTVHTVSASAFYHCGKLSKIILPNISAIYYSAFYGCECLQSVYLFSTSCVYLASANAFYNTPLTINSASANIYVPASLVETYKTAYNWSFYSSRFVGLLDNEIDEILNS